MEDIIVRYFHFLGIIVLSGLLTAEHLLLKPQIDTITLKRIVIIDRFCGFFAMLIFISGLTLWLWVGKPSEFYNTNWVLHLKVSLFVLAALLSIYPTQFLIKHKKTSIDIIAVPKIVIWCIRFELLILIIIPVLAVSMAVGIGG